MDSRYGITIPSTASRCATTKSGSTASPTSATPTSGRPRSTDRRIHAAHLGRDLGAESESGRRGHAGVHSWRGSARHEYRLDGRSRRGPIHHGARRSSEPVVQRWNGVKYEKPYARTRDVLERSKARLASLKAEGPVPTAECQGTPQVERGEKPGGGGELARRRRSRPSPWRRPAATLDAGRWCWPTPCPVVEGRSALTQRQTQGALSLRSKLVRCVSWPKEGCNGRILPNGSRFQMM